MKKENLQGGISFFDLWIDWARRLVRRWYYFSFKKEYVNEMLSRRRGECPDPSECNCCFDNPRLFKCPYASLKGCTLRIEGKKNQVPEDCKQTPFDEGDKSLYMRRHNCRFYWED